MEPQFEITLISKDFKTIYLTYYWYMIPNQWDGITLADGKVFLVDCRLLPANDSKKVTLIGTLSE